MKLLTSTQRLKRRERWAEWCKRWMSGQTCGYHKNTIQWFSGWYVLMKHPGHSEYINRFSGSAYCPTHYELHDIRRPVPPYSASISGMQESRFSVAIWTHEGRLPKDWEAQCRNAIRSHDA